MRIAVIGAGIVGVTTAFELARDGHQVWVFDRRGSVAAETSFANGGVVAPGYVAPWAAPGMPVRALRQMFSAHAPVRLSRPWAPGTRAWLRQWWQASRPEVHLNNRRAMQTLAAYSRERLRGLTHELNLSYEREDGFIVLLRTAQDVAHAAPGMQLMREMGIRHELLDARGCAVREPDLNPATPLSAGLYLPDAGVANCRQFAHLMKDHAVALGVRFHFHTDVRAVRPGAPVRLVLAPAAPASTYPGDRHGPDGPESVLPAGMAPAAPLEAPETNFDAVVLGNAIAANPLLQAHGLTLPMAAVHGYSLTATLRPDHRAPHEVPSRGPRSALMDERFKVALTRLGNRVRVSGSAELGGEPQALHQGAINTLHRVLHDWFPGAADLRQAQRWKGSRAMLPDGPPVVGASGLRGVFLNLGQGASGWTLACGSARVLADQIAGRDPAIDVAGLGIARLGLTQAA